MSDMISAEGAPAKRRARNVAIVPPPQTLVERLVLMSRDPAVDPDKLERMIRIVAESQYHDAMIDLEAELPRFIKDGKIALKGGAKPIRFVTFESLNKVLKPLLSKRRFSLTHEQDVLASGQIVVKTILTHGNKGEPVFSRFSRTTIPASSASPAMNAQQSVGAAISYAKRYNTLSLLNIESEAPDERDTDAVVVDVEKLVTAAQVEKMLKASTDVPLPLIDKHYLVPNEINFEEAGTLRAALTQLPANKFKAFIESCASYKERTKQ